jgi:putative N-acetylmannosamine-6-phosphate epimerase
MQTNNILQSTLNNQFEYITTLLDGWRNENKQRSNNELQSIEELCQVQINKLKEIQKYAASCKAVNKCEQIDSEEHKLAFEVIKLLKINPKV